MKDPKSGENFVFSDLPAGGWGGTPRHDGMNVTQDPLGNCANLSAEVAELLFPIRYEAFDLRADSAGAGRNRGGLGSRMVITMLGASEVSIETSRTRTGTPGVAGGGDSVVQRVSRVTADGKLDVFGGISPDGVWHNPLRGKRLERGDRFEVLTTGGGGWGDPMLREPARVLEDFLDGYVTLAEARDNYGVVIDSRIASVDREATERARANGRHANGKAEALPTAAASGGGQSRKDDWLRAQPLEPGCGAGHGGGIRAVAIHARKGSRFLRRGFSGFCRLSGLARLSGCAFRMRGPTGYRLSSGRICSFASCPSPSRRPSSIRSFSRSAYGPADNR